MIMPTCRVRRVAAVSQVSACPRYAPHDDPVQVGARALGEAAGAMPHGHTRHLPLPARVLPIETGFSLSLELYLTPLPCDLRAGANTGGGRLRGPVRWRIGHPGARIHRLGLWAALLCELEQRS